MIGRCAGLRGSGGFVVSAAILLAIVLSGQASARPGLYRWPAGQREVKESLRGALDARAVSGHALSGRARHSLSRRAHATIVGGGRVPIAQAPWQAEVFVEFEKNKELFCGGAIIDSTHIVTAAHCVFNPENEQQIGAEAMVVVAGTASITAEEIKNNPTVQARFVSVVRAHPMFEYAVGPGAADDVAVLTLKSALTPDTEVQPIGLASTGSSPPEGAAVNLTGFGEQHPETEPDWSLYSLGMTVGFSRRCGGEADAVFVCASAATGSACLGDSGSGLTTGATPTLVGIMDTVEVASGEICREGASNGFVNVAAPEIREFIEGSQAPQHAPRGGSGIVIRAVPKVGHSVTCEPGSWTGSPTFTYSFINSANGQTLQSGSASTYPLTTADVGRTIYCQVSASNAGGTGVVRTTALRAIEALPPESPPPPPGGSSTPPPQSSPPPAPSTLSVAGTSLTTQRSGAVSVKLVCTGGQPCSGKLTLQVAQAAKKKRGRKAAHTITIGTASFAIAAGKTASVTIHLNNSGRALLSAGHGRLTAQLEIAQSASNKTTVKTVHLLAKLSHGHGKHKK
jgi:trypsin